MPAPLLDTKLYLPTPPRGLVPRPQLCARMDRGATSKLMLVSAPAGFGKTTLLAEWLATRSARSDARPAEARPAAWLSLDRGDNEPATYWTYVIAALQTAAPGVGATARDLLQAQQAVPIETVLTTLLNDLGGLPSDQLLVLDDYHVIDAHDVQAGMGFLLDHLPPRLHVVIAGRADPALPLAQLRARGELTEVRVADLRFTAGEATSYLNDVMRLHLTASDVAALEDRTEGWIAALQLAGLSMQGRDDVTGFIADFAGDDRYIVDYLAEEVLQRQSATVRDFLLQTSILSRLSGPVCDAVTATGGGKAMLETLDRGNLFLVPLDDRRRWYRYHHLFADVLRARLADASPQLVRTLHRRASGWYADNGDQSAAIRHALAGEDFDTAANLVELAMPGMRKDRQEHVLRGWLALLPDAVVAVRPVLSNGYAGALLSVNEFEGVERRLRDAEHWFGARGPSTSSGTGATSSGTGASSAGTWASSAGAGATSSGTGQMVVVDFDELRRTPAWLAIHRAGLALALGDRPATLAHARRGLELLQDDDELGRGAATALIGLVTWASGDLETAHEAYTDCVGIMQRTDHLSDVLGCSISLADIRITQGRLRDAMRTYERALQLAATQAGPALRGTADMYVGMSALHRERNDLTTARQLLQRCEDLGQHNGLPQNPYRSRVAKARLLEAEGGFAEAVPWYDEAERVYTGDFAPNVRPVPAMRARAWLRLGRIDDASDWARDQGLSAADDLSYLREYEHVTLARALLARSERDRGGSSLDEADGLLERLREAAESGGRTGTIIEILVLQALAGGLRGDLTAALTSLERALTLAEPEGYVRIFVDEGETMAALLATAAERGITRDYALRLLAAMEAEGSHAGPAGAAGSAGPSASPSPSAGRSSTGDPVPRLIEPLSERELDVLRLLGTDLGGPEIARELVVSLNTVRTHTKNIYAKLGVNNRRAAVRRADELGLTSRNRERRSEGVAHHQ